VRWKNRAHFFALSAQLMRRILEIWRANVAVRSAAVEHQRVSFDEASSSRVSGAAM
jgi:hypothetical protein